MNCTSLSNIDLSGIEVLGDINQSGAAGSGAFYGCSSLSNVSFDNVKELGTYVIYNIGYPYQNTVIYFPKLEKIGGNPFGMNKNIYCAVFGPNLTQVTSGFALQANNRTSNYVFLCSTPPTVVGTLSINTSAIIYVPDKTLYQADSSWTQPFNANRIRNISEMSSTMRNDIIAAGITLP